MVNRCIAGIIVAGIVYALGFSTCARAQVPPIPQSVIRVTGDLAFGDVQVGQRATAVMTLHNDGNVSYTVYSISFPAGFSGDWDEGDVASGGSVDVTVTFSPLNTIVYDGNITVNASASSGDNVMACAGTGTAASAWDTGYTDLGGGWRRLTWFGDYVPMGSAGWIWHNKHGFFYVAPASTPQNIWLYAQDMGWLYTGNAIYPFLYRANDRAWLWYNGATNPRWFVNMATGQWERHD